MKPPFLILEAGLHGEDCLRYYDELLDSVVVGWSGWPRLVFKTQLWRETSSPWFKEIVKRHGREPLRSLSTNDLRNLAGRCRGHGLGFAVTVHDTDAIASIPPGIDYVKLGSFGAADTGLRSAVQATKLPTIISMGLAEREVLQEWPAGAELMALDCVSKYPANARYREAAGFPGYSCHAVPALAEPYVLDAINNGAAVVELHVSERPKRVRPLPGDRCVSLSVHEFMNLAEKVGTKWAA